MGEDDWTVRQPRRSTDKKEEKNTRLSNQQTDPGKDRKKYTHKALKHTAHTQRLKKAKTENESAFRGNDMRAQNANQPEPSKTSRIVLGRDFKMDACVMYLNLSLSGF